MLTSGLDPVLRRSVLGKAASKQFPSVCPVSFPMDNTVIGFLLANAYQIPIRVEGLHYMLYSIMNWQRYDPWLPVGTIL